MTGKTKLIEDLKEYFASKGKFLTYSEYITEGDAPYRAQIVKRHIGTWARLQRLVGHIKPLTVESKSIPTVEEKKPTPSVENEAKEPVKAPVTKEKK